MNTRKLLILAICCLLVACAAPSGALAPTQVAPTPTSPGTASSAALPSATPGTGVAAGAASPTPFAPSTPRPTLGIDEWKNLPVIATASPAMRQVYQRGLRMGNDPTHFSKIGDCQNVSTYFLSTFDDATSYRLGSQYEQLQPTIDRFQGSWSRQSLAVKPGFNVAAVLSPLRADPATCQSGESPLACEMRVWKPSIVVVSMETWWGEQPAEIYATYMRQVVDYILSQGAVPILATKADNREGDGSINAAIAQVAADYEIPLWNFWAAVQPLPDHGLSKQDPEQFHLTFARNFFDDPLRMEQAWPWRNLTALQSIDSVYRGLTSQP